MKRNLLLHKGIYIGLVIILMIGLTFGAGCSSGQDEIVVSGEIGIEVGDTAPDFTLADLDGNAVTLSAFRGKAVFITFWKST
ncbi:MAG: redoxin family protein [Chloroflexi bacterium]|jgi:hypothetical protein|nr:redoxin family protein [Chloroflexota bacterium]MBT7080092.1 redoxin family protein [Chloroflexota bacterium]MBT7290482.1 redoxin family protein [Chloroflexota bacterium]